GIIAVGSWRLPEKALRGVERGDVVVSPRAAAWSLTVGGRLRFAAQVEKGKLVVNGTNAADPAAEAFAADAIAAENPVGTDTPALAAVDEARVEMRAEVGRLGVTLAELRRLAVGEVVEFTTGVEQPVTLVAGGQAIATGELVDIGGRVGVRITAMAGKGPDPDA
ncbi:MAG: FliM/FliN family flagellar motor switch protein, partial [Planctomycetes bacterium]|nr:FliM/FliN family flagellar motor switch protein [Planctomycetota bacterium]